MPERELAGKQLTPQNLTIVAGSFPARSETFIHAHATGLARLGWQVEALASTPGSGMTDSELAEIDALGIRRSYWGAWSDSSAVRALQFGGDFLRDPSLVSFLNGASGWTRPEMFAARRMRRHLLSASKGPLHIHFGKYAALLSAAGWDRTSIVTWHGFDANMVPKLMGNSIYHPLFEKDWIHTVGSSFMRQRLLDLGARKDKIVKIPMGVDFDTFDFVDREESSSRSLRVISVGRLVEMKGHSVLIDAISEVKRRGTGVHLRIIGEGSERTALEEQIGNLNLASQVTLMGAQPPDKVVHEYKEADVFALTGVVADDGSVETQGMVYIEAQATGLPVIGADVGGVSDSLVPGETGILTTERDVKAVADALTAYALDPALRLTHGREGAKFVRSKFDVEAMLDAFEELYAEHAT